MSRKNINMTETNLWSGILKFSIPLIFSYILQVLFNMSDIAVVGQFAGSAALGAVGSTAQVVALFTGFLIGISSGVNSLVARACGAHSHEDMRKSVHTSLILCTLLGALLVALGLLFTRGILELLHTKDELIDGAELYLRIYFLGLPAVSLYNFGSGVFSAIGNTRKPLIFLFISGVLNVILNVFFVVVCRWDVAGVATATVISQYLSAILILISLTKGDAPYCLRLSALRTDRPMLAEILRLGLPAGVQNSIFGIANLCIQTAVNSFDAIMVEGNSAAANADTLVYDVMAAFYIACTSFIAQNYGAGNKKRVIKSYWISLFYSFAAGALIGGAYLLFGRQFLSIFTGDAAVIDAGMKRLMIMGGSYCFSSLMDNSIAACRGLGYTVVPTVVVLLGSCVFRVIWIFTVFEKFHTIPSLYLLYLFSWAITGIAEAFCFRFACRRFCRHAGKAE